MNTGWIGRILRAMRMVVAVNLLGLPAIVQRRGTLTPIDPRGG